MSECHYCANTLDDLMRASMSAILEHGGSNRATKGDHKELFGVLLELTNPRARLSQTETRGKPFSCLGELCWYLAGTNEAEFINYYIPDYRKYAENGLVFGGYGPRLFGFNGHNQVTNVINLLRRKPGSRRAAIQIFAAGDIASEHKDVPCTCTLQFILRHDSLNMLTYMRSNDAYRGLPHDFFTFTMLQEIVARSLGVELGTYKHMVGSLHLYTKDSRLARRFLNEGWQQTDVAMPPMPFGDPWPALAWLRGAEEGIRANADISQCIESHVDSYWADLIRLLLIYSHWKRNDPVAVSDTWDEMSSDVYAPFIATKLQNLADRMNKAATRQIVPQTAIDADEA